MTDNFEKDIDVPSKEIIIDDYFIEVTDEGGGTIDYTIIPYTTYQLIKDIQEQNNYIKRKEQECEKLKKELQAQRAFTRHEQKLIYCVAYDETCKTGNDCKQKKCIFKDNIKLKQTLTEIKEIATCCIEGDVARIRMKQILNKISEVIEDEEI